MKTYEVNDLFAETGRVGNAVIVKVNKRENGMIVDAYGDYGKGVLQKGFDWLARMYPGIENRVNLP